MIVLTARYTIQPGQIEKVLEHLREMAERVKTDEPECRMYRVHKPVDTADMLLLYEVYVDDKALEAHKHTPQFKEIIEGKVVPLLIKREREVFDLVLDAAE
jgi:autoinducer 2-degrading protein